jgi:O-antigen/teichoic acid export membrane protein
MNPKIKATSSINSNAKVRIWRSSMLRGSVVAGLRLLSVFVGLLYVKYYTNALSIEQVGVFFYLGTLSYVLNALVFVPIDSYVQARISGLEILPWRALLRLVGATLVVAMGICIALSIPFILKDLLEIKQVPLLYGLAALLYLCSSLRNLLNIRGHAMFTASMILLESLGRLIVFLVVVSVFGASAQMLLFSSILALVAELLVLFFYAQQVLPLSSDRRALNQPIQIIRTAATLSGGAASNTVQLQAYRVAYPAAGHSDTAAALGVTANIGAVGMSACSQVFSQLFLPKLYQSKGDSIGQYSRWAALVAVSLLTITLPLSEFLVRNLTNSEYVPYASAIGVGIVIEAGNLLIGGYSVYLTLHGRTGALLWFQLMGAIFSLTGCLVLLTQAPNSPILLGMMVAFSQLLVVPALALYVYHLKRKDS